MLLDLLFKRSSEKLANITYWAGEIIDLIMFSLIADHNCNSIDFDVAEFGDDQIQEINKYKRSINRNYRNTFVIRKNKIIVKSKNLQDLKPFIKRQIISAIPPIDYCYDSGDEIYKRFISNESYTDEILKLFDGITEKIFEMQIFRPSLEHKVQIYKLFNLITFKYRRAWQKIFTGLIYNQLHPESVVTDYFRNAEEIIKNIDLYKFNCVNISLIKVENNEIKITDAYEKNKLVLMPYLMFLITDSAPLKLKIDLTYTSIVYYYMAINPLNI